MAGQWVNVPGKGMRYLNNGRFTLAGEGEVKDTGDAIRMLFSNPRAYFGLKPAPAAASQGRYSGAGEFYSDPKSRLAPAVAQPKKDPRYTGSGAPIPERFGLPAGLVGGGNAGATGSIGTVGRTANPASNPPRVTPRAEVQSQALGAAIQQAQGPSFWESNTALKEAADSGPRAGTAGYANRADIQAWMEAMNKTESGRAMVQRFLDKERKAGRLGADQPTGTELATAAGQDVRAIQQREAQAAGMRFVDKSGLPAGAGGNAWLAANQSDPQTPIAARGFDPLADAIEDRWAEEDAAMAEMEAFGGGELGDSPTYDPRQVLNQPGADRELPTYLSGLERGIQVPPGQARAALGSALFPTDPLVAEHLQRAKSVLFE